MGTTGPQRGGRPHKVPPLPRARAEFEVLKEVRTEVLLGLALWEALRDVNVWARTEPTRWGALFHQPPPGFRAYAAAVDDLADVLRALEGPARAPLHVSREELAEACRTVYAWAEERAFLQTAAHFAEAAALVRPDAPALANLAARTCRRAGIPSRAGLWYQRGRALAVRARDFTQKFSASVGYGWLMYSLGRYDRARRVINKAATTALSKGCHRMAGEAEHALLAICSEVGAYMLGEFHARRALDRYPLHHPRFPALVHDIGYFYVSTACYSAGLSILTEAAKVLTRPQEQTVVWGSIARAAAGAHRPDVYATARDTALRMQAEYPEHAPATLRNVAYAAQLAGEWEVAEYAAHRAAELARARRMADVERTAQELVEHVRTRQPGVPEARPPAGNHLDEIVRACQFRVKKWSGPRRGRPPGHTPPA